jgi:uncharacterized membrane protein YtjA (UPF0391 family)
MLLQWTVVFLLVAIAAGIVGFTNVARSAAYIARVLFFIFLVLFILSLIF